MSSCEKQGSGESVREEPAGTEQQTSGSSGVAAGSEGGEENPLQSSSVNQRPARVRVRM